MATLQDFKTQMKYVNILGIANLAEKGVELPDDATTYEIMQGIAEIVGGSSTEYANIIYNENDTITLTDTDGIEHIMKCECIDDNPISIKYDDEVIDLTYDGDLLVQIGETAVDFKNVESSGIDGTDEIEQLIDKSGVLDNTEGTATEKVEQLLKVAERYNWLKKETTGANFQHNQTVESIELDCTNMNNLSYSFYDTNALKTVSLKNTQNVQDWGRAFYGCAANTIETLDCSSATSFYQTFPQSQLNNIKFVPETIKISIGFTGWGLTTESIQNIIDGLATLEEGATAQTLTLRKGYETAIDETTGKPILSDERKAQIQAKRWTLSLV